MKKTFAAILLSSAVLLSACGSDNTVSNNSTEAPSANNNSVSENTSATDNTPITIKVAGSTSVAPLMKELKNSYDGAVVEIQETGSSAGITATIEGAADIGMSSRDLKEEEKQSGLVDTAIALDGIAVIVHSDNPVQNLSQEDIAAIYKGEISNWSQLGGNDGQIIVVSREEGSGTRGAFEELLKLEEDADGGKRSLVTDDALFESSTGAVKTNVASSKNAIGYISLGTLDETVSAVSVNDVACSVDNVKNGSYAIARPFLICTLGEPSEGVQAFIDFMLSEEGQQIVVDNNYITVL